jgi:polar amino acid transport system substrate-binding protein
MKRQKTKRALVAVVACALVCVMAALALTGCGSSSSSSSSNATPTQASSSTSDLKLVNAGQLTVLSDCDYPPFIQLNGSQPSGFEYDLMDAIAKKMGLQVNFLAPQKFDTIITTIKAGGKADVGVSSFTITDERKQEIDFTDPYFDSNQALTVMKTSSYKSASDLSGKKVAAQSGTTGQSWAEENIPNVQMVPLDTATECFAALQSGQVEAVALDLPTSKMEITQSYPDAQVIQEIATGEQYGMVVSKDNTALRDALNQALADIKADGTYDQIMSKYSQYFQQ